jgi:subtilisin family serine protease
MSRRGAPLLSLALTCAVLLVTAVCRGRTPDAVADLSRLVHQTPPRPPEQKLTEALRARLSASLPDARLRVLVDLTNQLDLNRVGARLSERGAGRAERRRLVVAALRAVAEEHQAGLRKFLERLRQRGDVESYEGFTIVNRMHVVASPRVIHALAARDEVAAIIEEIERGLPDDPGASAGGASGRRGTHQNPGDGAASGQRRSWAIAALGADTAWRHGLDGRGIVVGIIDPGASAQHEQLRGNFRGGAQSWYDPAGHRAAPWDLVPGHGTGVLSVAVGQNVGGVTIGVAPGAKWVACSGLPRRRVNNVLVAACADWILAVAKPDVLVAPWVLPEARCDTALHRIVSAWRAAEIFPVFAAGNRGPGPGTSRSPANYTGLYPGDAVAFAVGGTTTSGDAYAIGSQGPGACGGSTYPVVVAPAVDVPAAVPLTSSSYVVGDGTSFAAGYAAGAVAILLQRFPEALVTDVEAALVASAIDAGTPGPDNTFGHGRIYIPAALRELERRLVTRPPP